jgi:hypothetical protein
MLVTAVVTETGVYKAVLLFLRWKNTEIFFILRTNAEVQIKKR